MEGLTVRICPECGGAVSENPVPETPWNRGIASVLVRGIPGVLLRPRRSLGLAGRPAAVPTSRAVLFAAATTLMVVVAWLPARQFLGGVALGFAWGPARAWEHSIHPNSLARLKDPYFWYRLATWEAWSIGRWWLLFGGLTLLALWGVRRTPERRLPLAAAAHRLLLFAPWIGLLELGYLIGVWINSPDTVPEPSTIYIMDWEWDGWLRTVWLTRGVVPTLAVGLVFFRCVLRWGWWAAIAGAVVLTPIAINLSLVWSLLYLRWVLPML
jgi:hypothetical protein